MSALQFNLLAFFALLAVIFQLPTRIHELVEAAGDVLLFLPLGGAVLFFVLLTCWNRPPPAFNLLADHLASWTVSGLLVAIDWLRAVGTFPDFVDDLLRNEELRSRLEPEYAKMRGRYKKQQQTIDALSIGIGAACSEYNKLRSDFSAVFLYRVRPRCPTRAKYQDEEWSEPHFFFKMCKFIEIPFFSFVSSISIPHSSSVACLSHPSTATRKPHLPVLFHLPFSTPLPPFVCS